MRPDAGVDDGLGPRGHRALPPWKGDGAFLGPEEAGDDVEDRGLAGAVGTDEAGDEALGDGKGGAVQCLKAAEALLEACCGKVGRDGDAGGHAGHRIVWRVVATGGGDGVGV